MQERQKIEGTETEDLSWTEKKIPKIYSRDKEEVWKGKWSVYVAEELKKIDIPFGNMSFSLIDNTPYPQLH